MRSRQRRMLTRRICSLMATYVIGDLQGCLSSFKQLAAQLPAADRYIFVGDLVNRGFESLATLRHVKTRVEHGKAVALLGNHDLHLLAVAAGSQATEGRRYVAGSARRSRSRRAARMGTQPPAGPF